MSWRLVGSSEAICRCGSSQESANGTTLVPAQSVERVLVDQLGFKDGTITALGNWAGVCTFQRIHSGRAEQQSKTPRQGLIRNHCWDSFPGPHPLSVFPLHISTPSYSPFLSLVSFLHLLPTHFALASALYHRDIASQSLVFVVVPRNTIDPTVQSARTALTVLQAFRSVPSTLDLDIFKQHQFPVIRYHLAIFDVNIP